MLKIAQHSLAELASCRPLNPRRLRPRANRPKFGPRCTLTGEVLEEARNATVYLAGHPAHLTLTRLVDTALRAELQRLRDQYHGGQPFPARAAQLKGGRPIAA